jgi:DNA mismatch endonuclease (patch repair protein)
MIYNSLMPDMFSKAERSNIMRAVRSVNNEVTEVRLLAILRRHKITGWRRHLLLPGKPDFAFKRQHVAVFVDGCFWHGCAKHLRMPKSNRPYWEAKISRNMIRDRITTVRLRKAGWKVVRVWEHDLHREDVIVKRLAKLLAQ